MRDLYGRTPGANYLLVFFWKMQNFFNEMGQKEVFRPVVFHGKEAKRRRRF